MGKINYFFILSAYIGLFCFGIADNLRGPLFPEIMSYYQLNQTMGGWFWAIGSMCAFFGSLGASTVLRYLEIPTLLILILGLTTVAFVMMGWHQPSYLFVLLGSSIFGISLGFLNVVVNLFISEGVPRVDQKKYFSGLHSMYALASLLAPFMVIFMAGVLGLYWRHSFFCVALMNGLFGVALVLRQLRERKMNRFTFLVHKHHHHLSTPVRIIPSWDAALFAFILGGYVVAEIMVSSRLAVFLREVHNYSLTESSQGVSLFFIFLFLGRIFFFFIPVPLSSFRIMIISNICSISAILLGIYYHPFFLYLTGLSMAGFYPFAVTYLTEKMHAQFREKISQSQAIQALLIMGMHLMMGILADHFGVKFSFIYGVTFLIISTAALVVFNKLVRTVHET